LITGESGTGKEVIADLITRSARAPKGVREINCAALPRELIESELFGSVKGAFTGAQADREGLFRQAEGGTCCWTNSLKCQLIRKPSCCVSCKSVSVRPVGGAAKLVKRIVRLIASTNSKWKSPSGRQTPRRPLLSHQYDTFETFRRLLSASTILSHWRRASSNATSRRPDVISPVFTPAAQEKLKSFDWPGNVRQLQNEIQRAVLMTDGTIVEVGDSFHADQTDVNGEIRPSHCLKVSNGKRSSLCQRD
jgi:DNA-binding NtrC family response regulator